MKSVHKITLSLAEAKVCGVYLSLGFLWLTGMMMVSFFIGSSAQNLEQAFYAYIDLETQENNGVELVLSGTQYHEELVEKYEETMHIVPKFYGTVSPESFSYRQKVLQDATIEVVSTERQLDGYRLIDGEEFEENTKVQGKVWISDVCAKKYGCMPGDQIVEEISDGHRMEYAIAGIYESEDVEIFVPFHSYYTCVTKAGYAVEHEIYGYLLHSSDYAKVVKQLKKEHIVARCSFESSFKFVAILKIFLQTVFCVLIIVSMISFSHICQVIFQKRMPFMKRLYLLGMPASNIVQLYFFPLELIVCAGILFARYSEGIFGSYVESIVNEMFHENIYVDRFWGLFYIIFAFVFCNGVLFVLMRRLCKQIDREQF